MRKLEYTIDFVHLKKIKKSIVPTLFTEHQFKLIEKKSLGKKMSYSEKNEFSRAVSRKMKAINEITEKESEQIFVYSKDRINSKRLKLAINYIKIYSRKFRNKHIFITGSFLYNENYNDIDMFVISKYDKEDYHEGKIHVNYLDEGVYSTLFFASIKKLCISNKYIGETEIKEKPDIDIFISLYQELFNDLDKRYKGIKSTLREFVVYAAFFGKGPIPNSFEIRQHIDSILKSKKPKEVIKKIFVNSIILGANQNKALKSMKSIISSYHDVMKEYKQHKKYYLKLIEAFNEVISIES